MQMSACTGEPRSGSPRSPEVRMYGTSHRSRRRDHTCESNNAAARMQMPITQMMPMKVSEAYEFIQRIVGLRESRRKTTGSGTGPPVQVLFRPSLRSKSTEHHRGNYAGRKLKRSF